MEGGSGGEVGECVIVLWVGGGWDVMWVVKLMWFGLCGGVEGIVGVEFS